MNTINNAVVLAVAQFAERHKVLLKTGKEFIYTGEWNELSQFKHLPAFVPGTEVAGSMGGPGGVKISFILFVTKVGLALLTHEGDDETISFYVDNQFMTANWQQVGGGAAGTIADDPTIVEHFFAIIDSYKQEAQMEVEAGLDYEESAAAKAFNRVYYRAPRIEFNEKWANSTGYYDSAVEGGDHPVLGEGQVVRALSPLPNDRRILIVGTALGNVVVFDRFTGGKGGVFVKNCSTAFSQNFVGTLIDSGAQSAANIHLVFGNDPDNWNTVNVGKWMKNLRRSMSKYAHAKGEVL